MTDADETPADRPKPPPKTAEVAADLAPRLCHDIIIPARALLSGQGPVDQTSAPDNHEEAMGLISGSARKLADLLAFTRVAFGASASAETFDARELNRLAAGLFNHMRAELDWQVEPAGVTKLAARTIMNLTQMAGAALPTGGVAKIRAVEEGASIVIAIEAIGPRARLKPEVLSGLRGEPMEEGLHGHWVQAYYVHLFTQDAGGRVFADVSEEKVTFAATVPI